MSLKSANKVEANKTELEIEISAEAFEEAIEKAYQKAKRILRSRASAREKLRVSLLKSSTARAFSLRTL